MSALTWIVAVVWCALVVMLCLYMLRFEFRDVEDQPPEYQRVKGWLYYALALIGILLVFLAVDAWWARVGVAAGLWFLVGLVWSRARVKAEDAELKGMAEFQMKANNMDADEVMEVARTLFACDARSAGSCTSAWWEKRRKQNE